ncbi:MAG: HlyD family efflux transporter periplasmic adaptor subunit [Gammaproteobacteria bacterium]|nr:HlyD family efflux transporter periplasmic adaptor subunit [Gammaproteobacteria bacterium]
MAFFRILLPILLLTLGIGGFILLYSTRPKALPVPPVEKVWNVATESIRVQDISPTLRLYGRVESPRESRLTAAITSDVIEVAVLEGEGVGQDTVLVQLDDREVRLLVAQRTAELAEIEAEIASEKSRYESDLAALKHERELVALAQRSLDRAQQLAATQVGSESGVDDAMQLVHQQSLAVSTREHTVADHRPRLAQYQARSSRAQAFLDQAELDLERTQVSAPFGGRVTQVHVAVGDRVRVGDALVDLYDTSYLEVRAQIPVSYLGRVRGALSGGSELGAHAQVDANEVTLTLDRIAGRVEPGRGGVDALFRVVDTGIPLELGRTVSLQLTMPQEANIVAVPIDALYGTDRVYELIDGRMQAVRVQRVGELVDQSGNTRVLVRGEGLADGDQIIISKIPAAIDGLRVQVVESDSRAQ